jgi:BT1 family
MQPDLLRLPRAGANRALGLSDKLFALGDSVIITALHRIALMPVFVLSARICPEVRTMFATQPGTTAHCRGLGTRRSPARQCVHTLNSATKKHRGHVQQAGAAEVLVTPVLVLCPHSRC